MGSSTFLPRNRRHSEKPVNQIVDTPKPPYYAVIAPAELTLVFSVSDSNRQSRGVLLTPARRTRDVEHQGLFYQRVSALPSLV
jgi:hypothetical protein